VADKYFKVDVYSHHFVLSRVQALGQNVVESFARNYVQFGLVKQGRKFVKAPIKVFAARVGRGVDRIHEYRFHIQQFQEFVRHLTNMQILPHTYEITQHTPSEGLSVPLEVLEKWAPKDYQVPIIEYLISDKPSKTKLLEVQTGMGKTFMACSAIAEIDKRFLIVIKPMYVDKWKSDLKDILGLAGDDVSVIQGGAALMNLITTAKEQQLTSKAIIISNKTLQNWFKAYERKGTTSDEGYDCDPADLCSVLDVGIRLIDEVHQDFHLNFKMDLYTNISRTISLSATLKADDPFLNRMYELTYPKDIRYAGLAYNKYIYAYSWLYQVKEPHRLRTSEWGSTIYSHHAFEKSLVQNREILRQYLDMIMQSVRQFFLDQYKKGDRLLIYCSSIQMCTLVVARTTFEFKDLDVRRYVEEDPYENLMQADVSVSTLLSAGTGVDIPMLTTVILTTSISSSQSNIQGFGRLRNIPNKKLRFVYFVCSDIPKQIEYHEKKKDMLSRMTLGYNSWNYPIILGNN
jgi:superfamily II DNA or RNA helicase